MNWKELYTQKTTTAEEAIKAIRDKDRVVFADAAGVLAGNHESPCCT